MLQHDISSPRPGERFKMLSGTTAIYEAGPSKIATGEEWLPEEEFKALDTPPFKERGKVTDEYLAAMKARWTEEDPTFEGTYTSFANVGFAPKPVQQPHPPIWVGGESPAALRRVVRHGDAWFPIGRNPKFPLDTPERLPVEGASVTTTLSVNPPYYPWGGAITDAEGSGSVAVPGVRLGGARRPT